MQQPPPRKVKPTVQLKNVHTEQLSKLQQKHQQEYDLLEDIRNFSKQRSVIEKDYAQALCKLSQQYLSKRQFAPPPELPSGEGKDTRTIMQVWKTVLDETDRVAKSRLDAADTYFNQISEPIKPIRAAKALVAKKVFDQTVTIHKEISQSIQEMAKAQKLYCDEEHLTHEASVKASDANAKVVNKSTGIFTSLAKLQQQSAKLNNKKELCEVKSTAARNEYLLQMAGCNAHQLRYYQTDLPELLKMLDGDMYDSVRDFFIILSRTELECCGLTQECFMKILTDSAMISRQYNLDCFLQDNPVYSEEVKYKFEPQDNDQVKKVILEHGSAPAMEQEAKKWATRVARENKAKKKKVPTATLR